MDKKAFKTLEEQVEILKERNLLFNDEVVALQFLARENYYKVMTSYKDLFLDKQEKETYLEGTNFEDIKNLYLLDRDLKSLYLKYLLIVENRFKAILSYEFNSVFPQKYAYLNLDSFDKQDYKKVLKVITNILNVIYSKLDYNGPIKEYLTIYENIPFWVLVNYFTIGNVYYFYDVLTEEVKKKISINISNYYNIEHNSTHQIWLTEIQSLIKVIKELRNLCAHDDKLYDYKIKSLKLPKIVKGLIGDQLNSEHILIFIPFSKILLTRNEYQDFIIDLNKLIRKYRKSFSSNTFTKIITEMGYAAHS